MHRGKLAYHRPLDLSAADMEELRELVITCWDPIGVHVPGASREDHEAYQDEYDYYLPSLVACLQQEDGVERLRDYLGELRTSNMGLPVRSERDDAAARQITEWFARKERTSEQREKEVRQDAAFHAR